MFKDGKHPFRCSPKYKNSPLDFTIKGSPLALILATNILSPFIFSKATSINQPIYQTARTGIFEMAPPPRPYYNFIPTEATRSKEVKRDAEYLKYFRTESEEGLDDLMIESRKGIMMARDGDTTGSEPAAQYVFIDLVSSQSDDGTGSTTQPTLTFHICSLSVENLDGIEFKFGEGQFEFWVPTTPSAELLSYTFNPRVLSRQHFDFDKFWWVSNIGPVFRIEEFFKFMDEKMEWNLGIND